MLLVVFSVGALRVGIFVFWEMPRGDALMDAARDGTASEVQSLLQAGANPNYKNYGMMHGTPLIWATQKSNLKIMKLLLQKGADVNWQDASGNAPLLAASTPQAVQMLLDAGANPLLRDRDGHLASENSNSPQVINLLQRAEAKYSRPQISK